MIDRQSQSESIYGRPEQPGLFELDVHESIHLRPMTLHRCLRLIHGFLPPPIRLGIEAAFLLSVGQLDGHSGLEHNVEGGLVSRRRIVRLLLR